MCVCAVNKYKKHKERTIATRNMQETVRSTKSIVSAGQSRVPHLFLQISPIHGCNITYNKIPIQGVLQTCYYCLLHTATQLCLISSYISLSFCRDFKMFLLPQQFWKQNLHERTKMQSSFLIFFSTQATTYTASRITPKTWLYAEELV